MTMGACDFCEELNGSTTTEWTSRVPGVRDRVVVRGRHLVGLPSLGPIAPFHVLLVPCNHVEGCVELSRDAVTELGQLYKVLEQFIEARRLSVVSFEHGAIGGSLAGGCGISHAHLHILGLPTPIVGLPGETGSELDWSSLGRVGWNAALDTVGKSFPYLIFRDSARDLYYCHVQNLPSQYLRRILSANMGNSEWDWRIMEAGSLLVQKTQELQVSLRVLGGAWSVA